MQGSSTGQTSEMQSVFHKVLVIAGMLCQSSLVLPYPGGFGRCRDEVSVKPSRSSRGITRGKNPTKRW